MAKKRKNGFGRMLDFIQENKFNPGLMRHFDWGLFCLVLGIALFGVACIFAATATPLSGATGSFLETAAQQPTYYARLQLLWIAAGLVAMAGVMYFDYELYLQYADVIYWVNVVLLIVVLGMERGRGNMAGWFRWGADATRTMQPSEFGKLAIIISLAKLFSTRKAPIRSVRELSRPVAFVGLPLLLIVLQPDVGTALVYIAIFGVMLFLSGADYKIIIGIVALATLMILPLWYLLNVSENSYRLERLMVYLDPTYDTNGAGMQVANAKIACGSGGMFGKGMFSEGCFASLNYIPDDYTDFIFAIVCETFGFAGAGLLVLAFALLLGRMAALSYQAADAFGSYVIIGVMAMLLFHIMENIGMVIGLLPVTGIPLPFISYGGSNLLSSMMGIGLVLNVAMRSRARKRVVKPRVVAKL